MKILLSGATGFIGKNLIKKLLGNGHNVCAIVRSTTDTSSLPKEVTVFIFRNNTDKLLSFLEKEKFDGVVHLASLFLAQHKEDEVEKLTSSNVTFPSVLLECAVKNNIPWFINTGTIWQHYEGKKYSPVNLYAATKQAFESIAQYYIETSPIDFVTIKLCDTFGPGDTRKKIINLLLAISKEKTTLDMSPGKQIIDISYIDNIVDGYMHMISLLQKDTKKKLKGKSFVIYSDKRMTLQKLVTLFEKISKTKLLINWGKRAYRPREVMIPFEGGKTIPGWKPTITLEKGILATIRNTEEGNK